MWSLQEASDLGVKRKAGHQKAGFSAEAKFMYQVPSRAEGWPGYSFGFLRDGNSKMSSPYWEDTVFTKGTTLVLRWTHRYLIV